MALLAPPRRIQIAVNRQSKGGYEFRTHAAANKQKGKQSPSLRKECVSQDEFAHSFEE